MKLVKIKPIEIKLYKNLSRSHFSCVHLSLLLIIDYGKIILCQECPQSIVNFPQIHFHTFTLFHNAH